MTKTSPAFLVETSIYGIHEPAFTPGRDPLRFVHVFPPSRVSCKLPSSVPTQITFLSKGLGAIAKIVV